MSVTDTNRWEVKLRDDDVGGGTVTACSVDDESESVRLTVAGRDGVSQTIVTSMDDFLLLASRVRQRAGATWPEGDAR